MSAQSDEPTNVSASGEELRSVHQLQRRWESLAEDDPLCAILSRPDTRGNRWNVDEFFATGEAEVATTLGELAATKLVPRSGRALDFGGGVGRLTRALAQRFDDVVGLDISDVMIRNARSLNKDLPNAH